MKAGIHLSLQKSIENPFPTFQHNPNLSKEHPCKILDQAQEGEMPADASKREQFGAEAEAEIGHEGIGGHGGVGGEELRIERRDRDGLEVLGGLNGQIWREDRRSADD